MRDVTRRSFLVRSGVLVAAAGTGGLVGAAPASAADFTGVLDDTILDQGGEVFNVLFYGAIGNGTADDTSAIQAAVTAASAVGGTVYAPPGKYKITSQIEFPGTVGLTGGGTKASGTQTANTVFSCTTASAGILVTGSGTFRNFECDGTTVATAPLQHGKLVSGVAQATSGATFVCVWSYNSAGAGFTIYGAQDSSYHDCRAQFATGDGFLIEGGAGGLHFWHLQVAQNTGYDIHAPALVTGGTGTFGDHTEDVHFYSGICDGLGTTTGAGKIRLRKATNWSFPDLSIVGGPHINGPTVDLDQSNGYGIDFTGAWIWGNQSFPGIDVKGTGPTSGKAQTFLITDDVEWHQSGSSVTIEGLPGVNRFGARGWMFENQPPAGPSGGPDGDTLLIGRTGDWVSPNFASGWSTQQIKYRVNSDGAVEFKGSAAAGNTTASLLFTLDPGYRPSRTIQLPVMQTNGASYVTISTTGTVTTPNPGLLKTVWMDGVSFPVR